MQDTNDVDWKDLFGSDDDDDDIQPIITFDSIPGLKLIRNGLSHEEQMTLTHELINQDYFSAKANQAMCFGTLPNYLSWLSTWVTDKYPEIFTNDILDRKPLFDQAILNMYKKGEGICSHVDLLRFEDGILIVSLLSSCVMNMRPAVNDATPSYNNNHIKNTTEQHIDVLLCPGDVLALSGDARYKWEHGIKEQPYDEIDGQLIERGTRISVTLRKLKSGTLQESTVSMATRKKNDGDSI